MFKVSDTPMWTFTVGYERDIIRDSLIWAGTKSGGEVSHTLHKFQYQVKLQSAGVYWELLPDSSGGTVGKYQSFKLVAII